MTKTVGLTDEMERILSLPVWDPVSDKEIQTLSREWIQAGPLEGRCDCKKSCRGKPMRLQPEQAAGIASFRKTGRGFACAGVGKGKTALGIMVAKEALTIDPTARILLLVPAANCKQFIVQDIPWSRTHLTGPEIRLKNFYKANEHLRQSMASSGEPGVYLVPHSLLSEEDARALLERINADLVIVDEAHFLKGRASARNRRFWDWVAAAERRDPDELPPAGFVMSGTMQTNTPADYHAIMRWTLGSLSVLPTSVMESMEWSQILRAGSDAKRHVQDCDKKGCACPRKRHLSPEEYDRLNPLLRWAKKTFPKEAIKGTTKRAARRAYKLRLRSAPGIVPMSKDDLGTGLRLENLDVPEPGKALQALIDELDRSWTTPDGDVLTYGIEKHQVMSQLTAGFYLKHTWPERHPKVRQAIKAHEAKQEYLRALRPFFASALARKNNLDTPLQAGKYWSEHGPLRKAEGLYELWAEWKELQEEDLPERDVSLVMVDDYKIELAWRWAKKHGKPGGIIWVEHTLFGNEVVRQLAKAGVKGLVRKEEGDDWLQNDGSEEMICVAGRRAHGTGKNLQHHRNQLLVQWCRPANHFEQLMGRCHRPGQEADELTVHTVNVTDHDHMTVAATLLDTVYDQQTMGGNRKLLLAKWDPLPVDYPPDFLRERGYRLSQDRKPGDDEPEEE